MYIHYVIHYLINKNINNNKLLAIRIESTSANYICRHPNCHEQLSSFIQFKQ